jgi:hypothetical protein
MLNAHPADLGVVEQLLLPRELAHGAALFGRLDVLVGRKVIGHHHHSFWVKDLLYTQFFELADGDGCCDVIREHHIHRSLNKLTGAHLVLTNMGRQDLFSQCHSHRSSLLPRGGPR